MYYVSRGKIATALTLCNKLTIYVWGEFQIYIKILKHFTCLTCLGLLNPTPDLSPNSSGRPMLLPESIQVYMPIQVAATP